jgi:exodeoxyribonuclease V gamma subunit
MLHVYRSHKAEVLARRLAGVLSTGTGDPMITDTVVVAGRGMERWLSMELAQRMSICMNVHFEFPARVVRSIMTSALGNSIPPADHDAEIDPWDVDSLGWAILAELPALLPTEPFSPLREYLQGQGPEIRRRELELVRRIADLFDRYANFRPDWISQWAAFDDMPTASGDWQPILWRAVAARISRPHPAARLEASLTALQAADLNIENLPPRLCLFGISTLPPAFVKVLVALSRRVLVHVFVLSPSETYIGDIRTARERARDSMRHPGRSSADSHDDAHPLLASLGRQASEFQEVLTSIVEAAAEAQAVELTEEEDFPDPVCNPQHAAASMLNVLQSDIVANRIRGDSPRAEADRQPLAPDDHSIRFHACHGELRQVEVLRDELLSLFRDDPTLQPRDVAILTPDIETYSPLVEAVFTDGDDPFALAGGGPVEAGFPRLIFRVADRSSRARNPVAEAVSSVLALAAGRLPASAVLDLLDIEPVRRKFRIDVEDLEAIRGWVAASGSRWGLDERHRAGNGLPPDRQNTWRFGLDRLLLGIAMPGNGIRSFNEVMPFDDIEGSATQALGLFARYCRTLFETCALIQGTDDAVAFTEKGRPRTPAEWTAVIGGMLDDFIYLPPRQAWKAPEVLDVFDNATRRAGADFCRMMDLDAARLLIDDDLKASMSSSGLLSGGINVCALVPMRSIPFRVIALIGMDDRAFPRMDRRPRFDLMTEERRSGDRSARDDDRQLFLESLLAAREHLVVTWTGHDIRDNSPLPPAVPVGELMDVLATSFVLPGEDLEAQRDSLVVHHPLQSFSPLCFQTVVGQDVPASFDRRLLEGATSLTGPKSPPQPFFQNLLPDPETSGDGLVVSVDDLARFFENPTRHILRRSLAIEVEDRDPVVEDREPLVMDNLTRALLGADVVKDLLRDLAPDDILRRFRGEGRIPAGRPGEILMKEILVIAQELVRQGQAVGVGARRPWPVDLETGGLRITGTMDMGDDDGLVRVQYGTLQPKHVVSMWVRHLIAAAIRPDIRVRTVLIGRKSQKDAWKGMVRFMMPDSSDGIPAFDPLLLIEDLAALYRVGMRGPLPFFPRTSFACFKALTAAGNDEANADLGVVRDEWLGGYVSGAEKDDPWFARVFGDDDAWRPGYQTRGLPSRPGMTLGELSVRVWKPLMACCTGNGG